MSRKMSRKQSLSSRQKYFWILSTFPTLLLSREKKRKREGKEWLHSTFFPPVVQPFPSWKRVIHQFPGQEPRNLGRFFPFTPLVAGPSPQFLSIKIWLIPPDTIKFHKVLRLCPKRRTKPPPRIPRAVVYYTREENSAGTNDRNSRFPSTGERTR